MDKLKATCWWFCSVSLVVKSGVSDGLNQGSGVGGVSRVGRHRWVGGVGRHSGVGGVGGYCRVGRVSGHSGVSRVSGYSGVGGVCGHSGVSRVGSYSMGGHSGVGGVGKRSHKGGLSCAESHEGGEEELENKNDKSESKQKNPF